MTSIALTRLDDERNSSARRAARGRVSWPANLAPDTIGYDSRGHLLILGNELDARRAAARLLHRLSSITLLVTERSDIGESETVDLEQLWETTATLPSFTLGSANELRLEGYLGRFTVTLPLERAGANLARASLSRDHFDLILDLGTPPQLALELPPPGYVAVPWGSPACDSTLEELPEMTGEFEKPRFFEVHHDLCAHDSRGRRGCTRCLDVCPADALASRQGRIEAWIEIDPYRCHGAGSCTSACPTGAIEYRLPHPVPLEQHVTALLAAYAEAGGHHPVVRFIGRQTLEREADESAGHVLDVPLEELGAAGLEQWLSALADGAAEVRLQACDTLPASVSRLLDDQLAQARALLGALGHSRRYITWIAANDAAGRDALPQEPGLPPRDVSENAGETTASGKRERLNAVIDRLAALGKPREVRQAMPLGAPFGGIKVATAGCTLCMSCVAVCPTPALAGGDDKTPSLSLCEADCVQCGLCQAACPEQVVQLVPGFLPTSARTERQVLKEEPAFECIRCAKPFATASTIAAIKEKLADHPYFAGEAMKRLEMCEDCRVRDVWQELARNPEAQLKV
ncbi:4Fe-4S dicluster domain-containing protein [Halomonas sp. BC04]|uniref:4Fe-4S dicluster domain-containing protein n=1 Tax=Halomonas sp. BC04 TaxID=1403540 RepID=UPI0003ED6D28|nr:4Fe-4S dicluster domain-containing protein [Halomonas sp. BC04]EWH03781.1 hypothetical protein Q427_01390 [Halomonas sp. BC04]